VLVGNGAEMAVQAGSDASVVGAAVWVVLSLAAGIWMLRAQEEYIRSYRRVRGVDLPLPGELRDRYLRDPGRWFLESHALSWRLVRIVLEKQPDASLERLRRRVIRRWWVTVAVVFLGASLPLAFAHISV